jgi:hypothetical protein
MDGGGSTELWAGDSIANSLIDGKERPVINALLVFSQIPVYLDGERLYFDTPPTITNGRTLVPLRKIFEELGAEVAWDQETKTVTAVKGDRSVSVTIDNKSAVVNGKSVTLDVPATLVDSRTLVPLRFVSEALGASVDWDQETSTVTIDSHIASKSGSTGYSS